jgi:hypothetical protein
MTEDEKSELHFLKWCYEENLKEMKNSEERKSLIYTMCVLYTNENEKIPPRKYTNKAYRELIDKAVNDGIIKTI